MANQRWTLPTDTVVLCLGDSKHFTVKSPLNLNFLGSLLPFESHRVVIRKKEVCENNAKYLKTKAGTFT